MKLEKLSTPAANYNLHLDVADPKAPYTIFLHGGPGVNTYVERQVLAPHLSGKMNFIWFDLIGCAGSPAISDEQITWAHQFEDVATIVKKVAPGPVNIIAHCLGTHITHDLVRHHRDLVRKVVWYSPARQISDIFKGIFKRAVTEGRLSAASLSDEEMREFERFQALPDKDFSPRETSLIITLAGKTKGYDELYWTDPKAMKVHADLMAEQPFAFTAFTRLQNEFFERGPIALPDYGQIPLLMLHADDDQITPWQNNGAVLMKSIKNAEERAINGGSHWLQFQKTAECAAETLDFLSK